MANKSRFIVAESAIKSFFQKGPARVFSSEDLYDVFTERRGIWNLPLSMSFKKFTEQLVNRGVLEQQRIVFESYVGVKERFIVQGASPYQVAVALLPKGFLSHFSALYLHGLTTQVPKRIYVSFEQGEKLHRDREMKQAAIDSAFAKPQRKAVAAAHYQDYLIIAHNAMYSGRAGITTVDEMPVASIERTLIDITVRPNYAGGVQSVLDAYTNALPFLSLPRLFALLDKMDFTYPYHQAIGFYLEKAGVPDDKLEPLIQRPKPFNFYLTYEMGEKDFSKRWKLYYPKGM